MSRRNVRLFETVEQRICLSEERKRDKGNRFNRFNRSRESIDVTISGADSERAFPERRSMSGSLGRRTFVFHRASFSFRIVENRMHDADRRREGEREDNTRGSLVSGRGGDDH